MPNMLVPTEPEFPAPSHAEINPESFWQAVCVCSQAVSKNVSNPVRALCLSSHGETFVPVNERNESIAPAILNQDNRSAEEAVWLEETIGRKTLFEITGLVAHPMYPVPKILWLCKHRPGIFTPSIRFLTAILGTCSLGLGYRLMSIILWLRVIWPLTRGSRAGRRKFLLQPESAPNACPFQCLQERFRES